MQTDVQITFRNMDPSDAIAARIRDRVRKLEEFHDRITRCRVVVEAAKRRHKSTAYQVHIDVVLPGGEVAVSRDHLDRRPDNDMNVAIRNAFDAIQKQLQARAAKMRREVKTHGAPPHGRIVRMFPDHGFIATADGEIYFHKNAVANGGFERMQVGDDVRFALAPDDGEEGPQASTVHPLGKHKIVKPRTRP